MKKAELDARECVEGANKLVVTAWPLIEAVALELSKRTEMAQEEMPVIIKPLPRTRRAPEGRLMTKRGSGPSQVLGASERDVVQSRTSTPIELWNG